MQVYREGAGDEEKREKDVRIHTAIESLGADGKVGAIHGRELVGVEPVGRQEHGCEDEHAPVEEKLENSNQLAGPCRERLNLDMVAIVVGDTARVGE